MQKNIKRGDSFNMVNLEATISDFIINNKDNYYRFAFSYVKNSADAIDVVHDSILKALSQKESLENPKSIKAWFYRIVANTALDLLRKQKKYIVVDDETISSHFTSKTDNYKDFDLQKALWELPTQYKSIVVLRYFEDLKIDEIALVLNENVNTVKTRLYKALNMMRIHVEEM